jgi:TFIIF-interacting CTD phosphatase-like protein
MIVVNHLMISTFRLSRQTAQIVFSATILASTNWRGLKKGLFDSYRPELHYMRGPGPKWHEAHRHADLN